MSWLLICYMDMQHDIWMEWINEKQVLGASPESIGPKAYITNADNWLHFHYSSIPPFQELHETSVL